MELGKFYDIVEKNRELANQQAFQHILKHRPSDSKNLMSFISLDKEKYVEMNVKLTPKQVSIIQNTSIEMKTEFSDVLRVLLDIQLHRMHQVVDLAKK